MPFTLLRGLKRKQDQTAEAIELSELLPTTTTITTSTSEEEKDEKQASMSESLAALVQRTAQIERSLAGQNKRLEPMKDFFRHVMPVLYDVDGQQRSNSCV